MADEVTERYRQALEGIDAALRRHVQHLRGDNRAALAMAEDVRAMLAVSGIGFCGATGGDRSGPPPGVARAREDRAVTFSDDPDRDRLAGEFLREHRHGADTSEAYDGLRRLLSVVARGAREVDSRPSTISVCLWWNRSGRNWSVWRGGVLSHAQNFRVIGGSRTRCRSVDPVPAGCSIPDGWLEADDVEPVD